MANFRQHKITVSTDCRFTGGPCRLGAELLALLNRSVSALGQPLGEDFSIAGTVCMAGCTRPCTIAFQATAKATYLFGDIAPEEDVDDLVSFAAAHAEGGGGIMHAADPSTLERDAAANPFFCAGLTGNTLARTPAALLVSEESVGWFQ
ncbi:DUF1636 domain-containing protein [Sinorhizobium numidicum]|uniref:DUF1636 domain-containing protein n=1 Tax=Sinorhizobium numidicum TaxID=680248 RepID=A0ABY8D1E0_9HYPH|nr:DUF1636 family protein [Sinorhizobium numidicum]WEX76154.1 DUF1636 domain-containing protein [Sinorhizobium numidicum]WEX82813.1 DUF1636 domain-containing protein [Sinorhizobium numidicum]